MEGTLPRIKIEVEVEMDGICVTCLSKGRRLLPVQAVECVSVLGFNFQVPGPWCWECRAMLTKLISFRQQAITAQQTLLMMENVCQTEADIKSLSKLSWQHINMDTFNTEFPQDNVKNEINYESYSNDDNNDNNVEQHETVSSEIINKHIIKNTTLMDLLNRKIEPIGVYSVHKVNDTNNVETEKTTGIEIKPAKPNWNYTTRTLSLDELEKMRQEDRLSHIYLKGPYKCETCIISYTNKKTLEKHRLKLHSEKFSHECKLCQQRLNSKESMESHYQAHFKCFVCLKCSFRHTRCDLVIKHYTEKHCSRIYQCKECQMEFETSGRLFYHMSTRHRELPRCDVPLCRKIFRNKFILQKHMKTHTTAEIPRQKCPICHKMINVRDMKNMQRHMTLHDLTEEERQKEKEKEWVHWCRVCQKGFASVRTYQQHLKYGKAHIQPDLLKLECHDCGWRSFNKSRLRDHIESAHLRKADHVCEVCSKAFTTLRVLRRHRKLSHAVRPASRDQVCELCGKAFLHKKTLHEHMNTHSGARPYKCEVCEDTFSYASALFTHNRLKHLKMKCKTKKSKRTVAEESTSD